MAYEFCLIDDHCNTQYAPLAALSAKYRAEKTFEALSEVEFAMQTRTFSPAEKLIQVLMSILAGCETLAEVNSKLKPEVQLAAVWGWSRVSDQANLSRLLDRLSQKQIEQLRQQSREIWHPQSRTAAHNWHGHLWLDFDLSGLPSSRRAEGSAKGYFSGKKRVLGGN
jgi:hypothetical protein